MSTVSAENASHLKQLTFLQVHILKKIRRHTSIKFFNDSNSQAKDEFEYMTNWSRIFEQLYSKMKWLKSYGKINHFALTRLLQKFMATNFKIEKNTLNRTMQNYIDCKTFNTSKALKMLTRDITIFYSKAFAGDNIKKAENALNKKNDRIAVNTAIKLSICAGACAVLLIVLIVAVVAEQNDSKFLTEVSNGIAIYYILFWLFLVVLGTAVCV
jgi:hypothetical protein